MSTVAILGAVAVATVLVMGFVVWAAKTVNGM